MIPEGPVEVGTTADSNVKFAPQTLSTQRAAKGFVPSRPKLDHLSVTLSVGTPPMSPRIVYRRVLGITAEE